MQFLNVNELKNPKLNAFLQFYYSMLSIYGYRSISCCIYSVFRGFSSIRTAFAVAVPMTWNLFQNNLCEPDMQIDCFRCTLKTCFFIITRHIEHIRGTFCDDALCKLTFTLHLHNSATAVSVSDGDDDDYYYCYYVISRSWWQGWWQPRPWWLP